MGKKKLRPKILFVYDHEYPHLWKDGLWAAIQLLEEEFEVVTFNLQTDCLPSTDGYAMVLGWGGFESPVDKAIRDLPIKKGLCIGGNAFPPVYQYKYDVLFYETEWYKQFVKDHPNAIKAFGVNTQIYHPTKVPKIFDVISVGAFALWKRQDMLKRYSGTRLAVGQIQRGNPDESMSIIIPLLANGVIVSDMVEPEKLAQFYNASYLCYVPANINGGGERAVLEARACGIMVDVEEDNPKLKELTTSKIPSEKDYAAALKYGIKSVL